MQDFAVLPTVPLDADTTFIRTTDAPPPAEFEDPAESVMTDFTRVRPITVGDEITVDVALDKMKSAGVRLLFVVNENNAVIGLVTAADIMGEKPVLIVRRTRTLRANIRVRAVMTRLSDIRTLLAASVKNAEIGHIARTLKQHNLSHMLVIDKPEDGRGPAIVGLFSSSEIGKKLGSRIRPAVAHANSLAELVHEMA